MTWMWEHEGIAKTIRDKTEELNKNKEYMDRHVTMKMTTNFGGFAVPIYEQLESLEVKVPES